MERTKSHNRSEVESRANSRNASSSDHVAACVIERGGSGRCIRVTCRIQAYSCLSNRPARKDVRSIKTEELEAVDIAVGGGMAPNTFSWRFQSRGYARGRLDHGD